MNCPIFATRFSRLFICLSVMGAPLTGWAQSFNIPTDYPSCLSQLVTEQIELTSLQLQVASLNESLDKLESQLALAVANEQKAQQEIVAEKIKMESQFNYALSQAAHIIEYANLAVKQSRTARKATHTIRQILSMALELKSHAKID